MQVAIALGSNLGDKEKSIRAGFDFLRTLSRAPSQCSSIYLTEPEGCPPGSEDFYNAVAFIETDVEPEKLLTELMAFEISLGRPSTRPKNAPRPLDLDILLAGDRVIHTERLTIPHPGMTQRLFVLEPLDEISPNLIFPHTGHTVRHHLLELKQGAKPPLCRRIA